MHKDLNKLTFLSAIMILSTLINAQTTTFNYLNSSLSTTACNVFNPAVNINSYAHSSRAGGVRFSTTNGLTLSTTPKSTTPGGTAFYITYPFTSGSSYTIAITAKGDPSMLLKTSVVPNLNQFNTTSTSSCTPDANVTGYNLVGTGFGSFTMSNSGATHTVSQFNVPIGNYQTLVIWATGGRASLDLDALFISSVAITKTTSPASFTLTPNTLPIQCGSSVTQTFKVTNVNNTPGITSYEWNLGSPNNGWIYNGSPAPQIITTTSDALTLTSTTCTTISNITAVAKTSSANYPTNTSAVTVTMPSISISGNEYVCSGTPQNYSLTNLPCGASVSWSVSPSGITSLSTSGNQATLSKIGDGYATLTATITNVCGVNTTRNITVNAVSPNVWVDIRDLYNNECFEQNRDYYFQVYNQVNGVQYKWGYSPPSGGTYWDPGAVGVPETRFSFNQEGYYGVLAIPYNSCGEGSYSEFSLYVNPFYESCNGAMFYNLTVAPNPVQGDFYVTIEDEKSEVKKLSSNETVSIQLYELYSKQVAKQWKFKNDRNQFQLNVSGLKKGPYVLQVQKGKYVQIKQIIIK